MARNGAAVQRVPTAGSDPALVNEYTFLMGSPAFQELDTVVTANNHPIHLVDSSIPPNAFQVAYAHGPHTIFVPVSVAPAVVGALAPHPARPLADVRSDLLFEMHSARTKGALARSHGAAPGNPVSIAEKEKYNRQMALSALEVEWHEWVNLAENQARTLHINATVGAGSVTNQDAPAYPPGGAGFYVFETYLQAQLPGHTVGYDPLAATPGWAGKALVLKARSKFTKSMTITPTELTAWMNGNRKSHIKRSCPFGQGLLNR